MVKYTYTPHTTCMHKKFGMKLCTFCTYMYFITFKQLARKFQGKNKFSDSSTNIKGDIVQLYIAYNITIYNYKALYHAA